jgi:hypothetical protein
MTRLVAPLLCLTAGLLLGALSYVALIHFQLRPSALVTNSRACLFCETRYPFLRHPPRPIPAKPYPAKMDLDRA